MPRPILSQRDQWPDRYADNNLLTAPGEVISPVESQNDDAFSDANVGPTPPQGRNVMEDEAMVQWLKQHGGDSGTPGGGGGADGGAGAVGGTPVGGGGGVPLIRKPDGTYTSSDPEWAKLINRESGGRNIKQQITDVNSGGNEAYGLFQITPSTWTAHGGQGSVYNSSPEQQAAVAANILRSNPSGSDWGAGLAGRENAQALMKGLSSSTPGTSPTAPGALNAGTPGAVPGQVRNVNPEHGQGPITGPDTHGALLPDTAKFQSDLMKQFPQLNTPGGYRPPDGPNEHSSGHALDVMIPNDLNLQKQVRDWSLQQPNVNYVLNQQKQWNPDGSSSDATVPGGNATANHWDHDHINVAGDYQYDPSVTPPATTPSTPTPSTSTTPATQPTQPTQPTQSTTDPTTTTPATQPAAQPPTQQPPPPMTLARKKRRRANTTTETLF